jgi:NAD(P)H-dependent FMN reductase
MNIPVILSTARVGRQSAKVAAFVHSKTTFNSELIDVRDWVKLATKKYPQDQKELQEKFKKADAFIIVSPEYNSGYPGELKILLDSFLDEYEGKPVGIVSVSAGSFGGIRMVEKLRPVLINLGMTPIRKMVVFKNIAEVFDQSGNLKDKSYIEKVESFIKEISEKTKYLKK